MLSPCVLDGALYPFLDMALEEEKGYSTTRCSMPGIEQVDATSKSSMPNIEELNATSHSSARYGRFPPTLKRSAPCAKSGFRRNRRDVESQSPPIVARSRPSWDMLMPWESPLHVGGVAENFGPAGEPGPQKSRTRTTKMANPDHKNGDLPRVEPGPANSVSQE